MTESSPSRSPWIQVVVTVTLLAAVVWAIRPVRSGFTPAPLRPPTPDCPKLLKEFTPTNLTAIPDPSSTSLSKDQVPRVLFRLNMEPCPCGCNQSIVACRVDHPRCATSERLARNIVADEKAEGER